MGRLAYAIICLLSVGIGVYAWRVQRTGRKVDQESSDGREFRRRSTLVVVGGTPISNDDIDFEYNLMTDPVKQGLNSGTGAANPAPLQAVPDFSGKVDQELSPLKQRIASQIIERKVLYKYIEQDKNFGIDDPAKFSACLREWDESMKAGGKALEDRTAQDRLKKMLCEKSIINQFLRTMVYAPIRISDQEIAEYYKKNTREFKIPQQVVIRQIVLSTEKDANAIKKELNHNNFAAMAAKYSITPEKDQGGMLGPFGQGSMPQVFDIAFSMRPGEIRGILKSTYGFHFVMLERVIPPQNQTLAQATPKIREMLTTKKKEEAYQKWVDQALNVVTVVTPKPLW